MAHTTQRIVQRAMATLNPITGLPLEPIGSFVRKDGTVKVVWPVIGAAEDGGTGGDGGAEGGDGTGSEGQGEGEGGKEDEGKQIDPNDLKAVQEELDRVQKRMQAADKRASEAEKKVREFEDANKDELTKATDRVKELETETETLNTALNQLRIENEFLASNKYSWHNPKRALSLVDLSEVTIGEDGKVVGLDAALDKLAKSDAYLLKQEDKEGEEEPTGKTSSSHNGRKGGKQEVDRDALAKKYPALRR